MSIQCKKASLLTVLFLVLGISAAYAHHRPDHQSDDGASGVEVSGAWTRPASAGGMGVGYAKITNSSAEPDVLQGASSDAAERVEIHETTINAEGVASMKPAGPVEIGAGKSIELKPGGMHVMLIGLKDAISDGSKVQIKLNFKNAGAVPVELDAKTAAPDASGSDHEHMHHHH